MIVDISAKSNDPWIDWDAMCEECDKPEHKSVQGIMSEEQFLLLSSIIDRHIKVGNQPKCEWPF